MMKRIILRLFGIRTEKLSVVFTDGDPAKSPRQMYKELGDLVAQKATESHYRNRQFKECVEYSIVVVVKNK